MPGPTSFDILKNTATLDRWRAYNREAYRPLQVLSGVVVVFIIAPTPLVTFFLKHHRLYWGLGVEAVAMALAFGALAWAALRARAYKKTHPFAPQP